MSGAWIVRTDRPTGSSEPWVHLNRQPELANFATYNADLSLSPDGSLLAVAATGYPRTAQPGLARSVLYLASTERADDLRRVDAGLASPGLARFSPDGRWLAVIGSGGLAVVHSSGGPPASVTNSDDIGYAQDATWSADGRRLSVSNRTNRGAPWTTMFDIDPSTGAARQVPS